MTRCVFPVVVALALTAVPRAQAPASELPRYLKDLAGFAASDVASFDAGQVIARTNSSGDEGEIAVIGAVRIHASKERTADYFKLLVTYVDGQVTLQYGEFHHPPQPQDTASLTLPDEDVKNLRDCKPGDCDVKIGGAGMTEIKSAVNWSAPDATNQLNALARRRLVEYVTAYMSQGNAALVTYNDKSDPVSMKTEWAGLLRNSPNIMTYAPALARYLDGYPAATLPGGTDLIYWAKEVYAGNPVVHADHMVRWQNPQAPDRITIAQKQIYASHYYNGSLAITTILDTTTPGAAASSAVIYFNRSRGDLLKGGFGGSVKRKVAESQAKKAAEDTLGAMKSALEKAGFPGVPGGS
ncbi:MAG TPA: hypothetical protein VJN96_13825 [Vicinamibacterales bacterium]|nr:hypothetical protein [Vicinamibacterales bacterium]